MDPFHFSKFTNMPQVHNSFLSSLGIHLLPRLIGNLGTWLVFNTEPRLSTSTSTQYQKLSSQFLPTLESFVIFKLMPESANIAPSLQQAWALCNLLEIWKCQNYVWHNIIEITDNHSEIDVLSSYLCLKSESTNYYNIYYRIKYLILEISFVELYSRAY